MTPAAKKTKSEEDALKRKILFVPQKSKKALHKWIRLFMGLDIPDCIVDATSNSSPMDMIWECYSKGYQNNDPSFARVLYYASRESFKTLASAILEVLAIFHLKRNVAHMAAIEAQSRKAQQYVRGFLAKPILRDYVSGGNLSEIWITRYEHMETGENIPPAMFNQLPFELRDDYEEIKQYIHVVICTMAGANSEHVPFFVVDEVEVVRDPHAYEEAKMIPGTFGGIMPITVLTSTRKISTGIVQREIDEAVDPEDGHVKLHIRHWNVIDVTQACPPDRHLPEEPKIPIWVNDSGLRAISQEKYEDLTDAEKLKYKQEEGFAGCLKNCRIFASCHGRLATHQKSRSPLLKPIAHTSNRLGEVSVPTAQAQLLCKKPSTENLVYPNFDRQLHVIDAAEMAEMILGFPVNPNLTKKELIDIMQARGLVCYAGMDFGFSHNFAVVTFFADGHRAFVVDVISEAELLPDQKVKVCNQRIKAWNPVIYPDPENREVIAVLRKAGFRMRDWQKLGGSVVAGINVVHMRLRPPMEEPLLYFLAGDPGIELLAKRLEKYHWKEDAAGRITDKP